MRGCRHLNEEEYLRLLSAAFKYNGRINAERLYGIAGLMRGTGLRVGETVQLKAGEVAYGGYIREDLILRREITKGKRIGDTIPLNNRAREGLTRWLDFSGLWDKPGAWLFPVIRKGAHVIVRFEDDHVRTLSISTQVRLLAKRAKLTGKVNTHSFRKTFAQELFELSGYDIRCVQYALRHKTTKTTECYLAPAGNKAREIIRAM